MERLLSDRDLGRRLAARAKQVIEREHTYEAFKRTLYGLYSALEERPATGAHAAG
jgi:hypothetical protein